MNYGILSLIPILLCFFLILLCKNAFVSILSGIVVALILVFVQEGQFILFQSVIAVFSSTSTVKTVLFILIVGALVKGTEKSGGVSGLVGYLERKKVSLTSPVLIQLFTMMVGMLLFVDATSSMAITSIVGKPLFRKVGLSTEKLALITNSTASPIAWIIPFGGAGALMTGLISTVDGIATDAFSYVLQAVPLQFYTILLLLLLVGTIVTKVELGSIKEYKRTQGQPAEEGVQKTQTEGKARMMLVPILLLLMSIFGILLLTGQGSLFQGDGSSAVFYGGLLTLFLTLVYYVSQSLGSVVDCLSWYWDGVKSMATVTLLLAVALVFSDLLARLGTATYLVGLFDVMPANFLPFIALILSGIIAFCTGTSGGTVAIVTGLLLPMAVMGGVHIPLVLGAIVSGAVFGDQNSVISDSVILTASLTGVDPLTHVKTQLPYTLIALGLSAGLYLILGFVL